MNTPTTAAGTARLALLFWGVAAAFVVAGVIVYVGAQALLLAFGGILFGTSLRGAAEWLSARTRWRVGWSLAACIAVLLATCIGAGLWIVPSMSGQLTVLADLLASALDRVRAETEGTAFGDLISGGTRGIEEASKYIGQAAGALTSAAGVLASAVFVVFVTVYVAATPHVYRRGFLRLFHRARHERMGDVLDTLALTLRRWMLGRMISMLAVGIVTTVGLWILGIPLPIVLGLLAGVLGFIPNIGPIASAVPALLLAATLGIDAVGYVLILYVAINVLDGYLLTPWVEKRAVATPAALVITSQLLFGALWGILGLTFATPLLACALVLVRMLYVEDVVERARAPRAPRAPAADNA